MATGHGSKSKGADMTLQEIVERIQSIQSQLGEDNTAGAQMILTNWKMI